MLAGDLADIFRTLDILQGEMHQVPKHATLRFVLFDCCRVSFLGVLLTVSGGLRSHVAFTASYMLCIYLAVY